MPKELSKIELELIVSELEARLTQQRQIQAEARGSEFAATASLIAASTEFNLAAVRKRLADITIDCTEASTGD